MTDPRVNQPAAIVRQVIDDLAALAAAVMREHARAEAAVNRRHRARREELAHRRRVGEMLSQARERVYGGWVAWFNDNVTTLSLRRAYHCMTFSTFAQCAKLEDELENWRKACGRSEPTKTPVPVNGQANGTATKPVNGQAAKPQAQTPTARVTPPPRPATPAPAPSPVHHDDEDEQEDQDEADAAPTGHQGVATVVLGNNDVLIREVARLYILNGDVVADATYGLGVFWRLTDTTRFTLWKSDILPRHPDVKPYDLRKLPYRDGSVDVGVLDPPYKHNPGRNAVNDEQYQNSATTSGMNHADIMTGLYEAGMREMLRVIKHGGRLLVKCMDQIQGSTQCWSHIEIHDRAVAMGWYARDLFIVVPTSKTGDCWKTQEHARKHHSYLWVFQKGKVMLYTTKKTKSRPSHNGEVR
jgi:hypothetical protein